MLMKNHNIAICSLTINVCVMAKNIAAHRCIVAVLVMVSKFKSNRLPKHYLNIKCAQSNSINPLSPNIHIQILQTDL